MTKENVAVNREYKDRLFKKVFEDEADLLELYNALNGTSYDNPAEIEVNTLEDVVCMGMRNDISFLCTSELNLFEHQSTFHPNLPLRGFLYFSDLYRKLINDKDIYSSRLLKLPLPQFIIFYNGNQQEPERRELLLSDSFKREGVNTEGCLECKAVMLNINLGYNKKLMDGCKKLKEYAQFVDRVKKNLKAGMESRKAVNEAIDYCIKAGILAEFLSAHRAEVVDMLLTEYDEAFHIRCERKIAEEEGREVGRQEGEARGRAEGRESRMQEMILNMLELDMPDEQIRKVAECDQSLIDELRRTMKD